MGDIRDFDSINKAIRGCDTVFNLAAMISVQYSFELSSNIFRYKCLWLNESY